MAVADLLATLRIARGLSQRQLADVAAVSIRAINDIERGRTRRPQQATLDHLADGLELTTTERDSLVRAARIMPPRRPAPRALRLPEPLADPSLIGRSTDLAQVLGLLQETRARLVTLTGPAGVGKSRLALAVLERVPAGLGPISVVSAQQWPQAAAELDTLTRRLGDRPALIVLDDVPTPGPGSSAVGLDGAPGPAATVAGLLGRHAGLRLLVTGRSELYLHGEHLWPVGPLPVGSSPGPPDQPAPAVELLVERARLARPGFQRTAANAVELATVARQLGGIPLAIELAAAYLRGLDPPDLAAALADVLPAEREPETVVPTVVRWSLARQRAADQRRLAMICAFPAGVAASRLPPALAEDAGRGIDAALAALAGSALITVTDRGGQAWLTVHRSIRDQVGPR